MEPYSGPRKEDCRAVGLGPKRRMSMCGREEMGGVGRYT